MKDPLTSRMRFKGLIASIILALSLCAGNTARAMSSTASSDADCITPELTALAAGLKNDREMIFKWVQQNIRYVQYYGCKKGAYLTYLERSGNDADQSALLVALWRAAGISCQYAWGWGELPVSATNNVDWYHYLGADSLQDVGNGNTSLDQLVWLHGEPTYGWWLGSFLPNSRGMARVWVQTNVSGTLTNYDPSFKLTQPVAGLDVVSIMGYSRINLLASLGTGTSGTNFITGLNYSGTSGLSTYLSSCASLFVSNFRNSYLNKTVGETVGGWKPLASDNLSFPVSSVMSTNDLLDNLTTTTSGGQTVTVGYATLRIQVFLTSDTSHTNPILTWGPVNIASMRGRRLGLVFESNKATLKLDDTQVAQAASTTASGAALDIVTDINHAGSSYAIPGINVTGGVMPAKAGGTYALIYGFDVSSEYLSTRQQQLSSYQQQGLTDSDPRVSLETLNVIGLQWMQETNQAFQLVGNLKNMSATFLHRFGRVAQEPITTTSNALYIDVPFDQSGLVSRVPDANAANTLAATSAYSFISSAMEHGVLEQTQPAVSDGVSTAKVLKLANEQSVPIYLANTSNWLGVGGVQSQLTSGTYNSTVLGKITGDINAGASVLLPKTGQMTKSGWNWSGNAYASILTNPTGLSYWKMIIGTSYNGGFSSNYTSVVSGSVNGQTNASPTVYQTSPVTLPLNYGLDGNFTHQRELLTAGDGLVRGLNLIVSYNGGNKLKNDAKMGYGWTHSYYVRATELADVEGAFGEKTPVEMAASIVGAVAAVDIFANRTGVKDWLGTALIANWTVDQLKGSAVSIVSGDRIWQFHKQPDGSYSPPPGATQVLTKPANYQLVERNGPTWRFDSSLRLLEIEDLWGKKLTLTYNTNGDLASVTDAYTRKLTFTYQTPGTGGTRLDVTDNAGRIVSLWGNSSRDLTSFSDAEGKLDIFEYVAGHLLSKYTNHDNNIVVANSYDGAGRLTLQDIMGDTSKRRYLYYAPGQTIEKEQGGEQTVHYFDDRNREIEVDNALGHRFLTTYDAQDRITKKETLIGTTVDDVTSYTYDGNHNLLTETNPKGKITTNVYDSSSQLTSTTDKRGNIQYFQNYNAQHQPTQTTDREGQVVTCTYKGSADPGAGSLATTTESGNTTTYGYDSWGEVSSISYPGGASESMVNNSLGDPTSNTDELGRQTSISYNLRREAVSTTTPGTASSGTRTTTAVYDNNRDVASTQNARGFTTGMTYRTDHSLLTTTLPDGALVTNHYNNNGDVDWTSNPLGQTVSFGFDALGRTTSATDPLSRTTSTIYQDDLRKTIAQTAAPLSIQTKVTVDERGQVVKNEDGLGNYAVPSYDDNGNQATWVDRRGKTWQFTYDKEDRLKNTVSPLARTTAQTWNTRGLLATIAEPSGQTTTFGYDGRGQVTSKVDAVGTVNYGLDNAGQLLTVTQGAATLTSTYHASGEVATYKNANNETISYDYDKNGNLVSLTYPAIGSVPAATVTYTYDNRDRLTSVTDWAARTTTYSWDAAGKLTLITRPNGTKRRLSWDAAGQMLAVEERPASGAPFAIRSFGYDAAGRITKRLSYPQATIWVEPAWSAGYDDDNRMTSVTGGTLSYDTDGNLLTGPLPDGPWGATGTSTAASGTFTWNARNQLTRAMRSNNSQQIDYTYDAEGNLIQTTDSVAGTTRWIVDPSSSRVLAKVAPGGAVTRYIYGAGLVYEVRSDGSVRYYHYDQVGSTVALTDSTGAVTGRADYTPYGGVQGTSGELATQGMTPFMFVGAHGVMTDPATGLHQMRARWYSSYLRRFLSEDPSGFAGGENSYAYAGGNPVNLIDPNGLKAKISFENISNEHKKIVKATMKEASYMANKAYKYISSLTLKQARIGAKGALYREWYGVPTKNRLRLATEKWQLIAEILRKESLLFVGSLYPKEANENAYSNYGSRRITLYPKYWVWTSIQASTIVHEVSHEAADKVTAWSKIHSQYWQFITDQGHLYGDRGSKQLAQTDPDLAVLHADNYEGFAAAFSHVPRNPWD